MIQNDFAWTFATNDVPTLNYVRNNYIPKLKADINEMQNTVAACLANDQTTDAMLSLQETIGRQKQKLDVAESRLHRAVAADAQHEPSPLFAVVIEGGLVQAVVTNHPDRLAPDVDVQIIDYDTEGVDECDLLLVPQSDGSCSEARGHIEAVTKAAIDIDGIKSKTGS